MCLFILGAKQVKDICTGQENPVINIISSQQEENFMLFSPFAMESGFAVEDVTTFSQNLKYLCSRKSTGSWILLDEKLKFMFWIFWISNEKTKFNWL